MGRKRLQQGQLYVSLLLVIGLLLASFGRYSLRTPEGRQCPTAPVQVVVKTIRTCCGKVIGVEKYIPQPGDKAFHQCRCEEKKSVSFEFVGAVAIYALPPVRFLMPEIPPLPEARQEIVGNVAQPRDRSSSPAPPPPRLA